MTPIKYVGDIPSTLDLISDEAKIAVFRSNLIPEKSSTGTASFSRRSNSLKINFDAIMTGSTANPVNTFAVTLHMDGEVTLEYGDVGEVVALVGISEGGGASDPGESDFSAFNTYSVTGKLL